MKRLFRFTVGLGVALSIGCASTEIFVIEYEMMDIPEEQRIEIQYRNDLKKEVCLLPEMWPNHAGRIDQAGDRVFLVVNGLRFPIVDVNLGYCLGDDCVLRVDPMTEIVASISYEDFGIPEELYDQPKSLEFTPGAYICRGRP